MRHASFLIRAKRELCRGARLSLVFVVVALAGCPRFSNDGLTCGANDACPPGYHCATDKRCWKQNQNPPTTSTGKDMSASVDDGGTQRDLGGGGAQRDLAGFAPGPDLAFALALGQLCGAPTDCASHNCVDGVCCDLPCSGACSSCNQASNLGHCTSVPSGNTPSHGTCGPDTAMSCGRNGKCDGAGNCAKWDSTTVCGSSSCMTGMLTNAPKCDGNGTCVTPTPIPCDPYVCKPDNTTCYTMCTAGATECKSPNPCTAGSCGTRGLGQMCSAGTDCTSGNCVDTVCCDKPQAQCNGCQTCNGGVPGTCGNVASGDPHNVCPTNASGCVAGGCSNGACTPSTVGTICASSCASTDMLSLSKCNGSLGCPSPSPPVPCAGSLICADGASCKQSCGGDTDCVGATWCNGGNCAGQLGTGSGCSRDQQCATGYCVDGACCTSASCGGCYACGVSGHAGNCWPVPSGTDPNHVCPRSSCNSGCNGAGGCNYLCSSKEHCACGGTCLCNGPPACECM